MRIGFIGESEVGLLGCLFAFLFYLLVDDLFVVVDDEAGDERLVAFFNVGRNGPVFFLVEILDFLFTFHDQSQCRALYPPG